MKWSKTAVALAIGLSACRQLDEPPVVATSRYVEYASDSFEPCPEFMSALDAYIEAVYEDLGADPPSGLLLRYNHAPDGLRGLCAEGAPGCACVSSSCDWPTDRSIATVFSTLPAHHHEIAHAIAGDAGYWTDRPFIDEGFAERYSSPDGSWAVVMPQDEPDLESLLSSAGPVDYFEALVFAQALVDRHGLGAYLSFIERLASSDAAATGAYEVEFGESLHELSQTVVGSTYCVEPLAQCSDAALVWDSSTLVVGLADEQCEVEQRFGPAQFQSYAASGAYRERRATVHFDVAGEYLLEKPPSVDVALIACDQACDPFADWQPFMVYGETASTTGFVNSGEYELVVLYPSDTELAGEVRLTPN